MLKFGRWEHYGMRMTIIPVHLIRLHNHHQSRSAKFSVHIFRCCTETHLVDTDYWDHTHLNHLDRLEIN